MLTRRWLTAMTLTVATTILAACGAGTDAQVTESAVRVFEVDRTYSPEDFVAVGFKQLKAYDVEGLPEATDAVYGFWRTDGQDARDYELRFYRSHEDAVQFGASLAAEVTGDAALIFEDDLTWKEGARDRRHQVAVSIQSGGELVPTYMDYAIHGNVVMLCEGLESAQSLDRCNDLSSALPD